LWTILREGSFYFLVSKDANRKTGWQVQLIFKISLAKSDKVLLERIKAHFGVGEIYTTENSSNYKVVSLKDLTSVIIPHFEQYPLVTQKRADFELFKSLVELMNKKKHLTYEGLQELISIKASMNYGLSDTIKAAFPNITPIDRPIVQFTGIQDPRWLSGFTNAEGCFFIKTRQSTTYRLGSQVSLSFTITQHARDKELLTGLVPYLGCGGSVVRSNNSLAWDFKVNRTIDINEKIIPFFYNYPLEGAKRWDFEDFWQASKQATKVAQLMENKAHLTREGLYQIIKIKSGTNKGRSN
jgi:hypothetical protein